MGIVGHYKGSTTGQLLRQEGLARVPDTRLETSDQQFW